MSVLNLKKFPQGVAEISNHQEWMDSSICCRCQAIKMKIGRKFSVPHTHTHERRLCPGVINTQLQKRTHTTLCVNFTQTQLISPYNPVWVAITYNTNTGVCLHGNVKPTTESGAACRGRGMRHRNPDHDIITVFQSLTHRNETEIKTIESDSRTSAPRLHNSKWIFTFASKLRFNMTLSATHCTRFSV